ncbi:unnamed protein product [Rotaria sp. Silwood1]|nr:unnamed protein product [Rotaria sp. Silwood1]
MTTWFLYMSLFLGEVGSPNFFDSSNTDTKSGIYPSQSNSNGSPPQATPYLPNLFVDLRGRNIAKDEKIDFSLMTHPSEKLRIIAQPKAFYRERYCSETDPSKHRAQRFIRADDDIGKHEYPTVQIPLKWRDLNRDSYIRVTLVTIFSEKVPVICIHPYIIDTPENHVLRDSHHNSLYFPITKDDVLSGHKSFRINRKKMVQHDLKSYGPLHLFDLNQDDIQRVANSHDAKQIIETYQLWKSQLVFTVAERLSNDNLPIPIPSTSVTSQIMCDEASRREKPSNNHIDCITMFDDDTIRCTPKKGDWNGGDEILMTIPRLDKRKIFHHTYDDDEFNRLPTGISLYSISQVPNNEHHNDVDSNLLEPLNELSPTSSTDEFIKKILDSDAPSPFTFLYDLDESLFPGYEFDENQIEDTFEGLPNEATTTTATINAENNNGNFVNGTSSESISNEHENLKPDDNKSVLKQSSDDISLQMIDNSIEQRTMIFESQPPASIRYRYGSDGKRQIDKSRTKPSIIKLPPGLKDIKLNSNQSFGLRLGLITYSENLLDEINFHVNKLEYHSNDVHKFNDNTVGILLTPRNIEEERIVLSRQSIVKTTLNNYKRKLIPLCLTGIPNDPNENMNEKISVREAKEMYKKFNLKASRIICQLVIKQNDLWHFTNIKCETQVIQDKDQKSKTQKRSAKTTESDEDELLDECPSTSKPKSKSTKRKKRSA